jgi:RNA 3'-terminal phosphate cyclase (ATP)
METSSGMITIDGSAGEGGGQILRNAISYANILRKEIHIHSIRAGRPKPGLQAQHMCGIQLATSICGGILRGDTLGSKEIHYQPAEIQGLTENNEIRDLTGEILTAGSISLLLQAAIPCALFSPTAVNLRLTGGTNASMAPQYDYWARIFLPTLVEQCKLNPNQIEAKVIRRGYFPRGGGIVKVQVNPVENRLRPITLTFRGKLKKIFIRSFYAGDIPRPYATRMANEAQMYLRSRIKSYLYEIIVEHDQVAAGSGTGILIVATFESGRQLAGSALGIPKKQKAKEVGCLAAAELYQTITDGGCVDEWLQDQLILYAALADGVSEIVTGSLTLHTYTAIMIAEQMAGAKFEILKLDHFGNTSASAYVSEDYGKKGRIAGKHLIRCHGIGFQRTSSIPQPQTLEVCDNSKQA